MEERARPDRIRRPDDPAHQIVKQNLGETLSPIAPALGNGRTVTAGQDFATVRDFAPRAKARSF